MLVNVLNRIRIDDKKMMPEMRYLSENSVNVELFTEQKGLFLGWVLQSKCWFLKFTGALSCTFKHALLMLVQLQ